MKKYFWTSCLVSLVLTCLHTVSATALDAYRPKKASNSLSCRFEDTCDSTPSTRKQTHIKKQPVKKTMKRVPVKQTARHVR